MFGVTIVNIFFVKRWDSWDSVVDVLSRVFIGALSVDRKCGYISKASNRHLQNKNFTNSAEIYSNSLH